MFVGIFNICHIKRPVYFSVIRLAKLNWFLQTQFWGCSDLWGAATAAAAVCYEKLLICNSESRKKKKKTQVDGFSPHLQPWIPEIAAYNRLCHAHPEQVGETRWGRSFTPIKIHLHRMLFIDQSGSPETITRANSLNSRDLINCIRALCCLMPHWFSDWGRQ